MEYEKCYVFQPEDARSTKRRRIEPRGLQSSWNSRRHAYTAAWQRQKEAIDERLDATNASTIDELASYLAEPLAETYPARIRTAIISAGADVASQQSIVQQLQQKTQRHEPRVFVSLSAASAPNLKAALKTVIQRATSQTQGLDEDDELQAPGKGPKLLNYDLQILHEYFPERGIEQVVLSIEDTEAFNSELLSELIEILGCWQDRIPFVLLLNVATSLEFLQQRLTRDAVKCLDGKMFEVAPASEAMDRVLDGITGTASSIWMGPNLLSTFLERQSDYIQSIDSFVQAVQYAYMSCFYANALSIFLAPNLKQEDVSADHFEAARMTQSFAAHCRSLLDAGDARAVKELLDSDEALFQLVQASIEAGHKKLSDMRDATVLIGTLLKLLQGQPQITTSRLYLQSMSNKLQGSSLLRSMLLSIRKATSNTAIGLLDALTDASCPETTSRQAAAIREELKDLVRSRPDTNQPLRSEDDVKNSTLRTTVVSQKIELSKQKSTLSKEDAAYTGTLRRFTDLLEGYLTSTLVNPRDLLFHEIFLYDLKSPHREAFTPRPRHALERALAAPHDYLDCQCCAPEKGEGDGATLAATQPATAILYQLYLESGSLINASDLWQAFQAVMGDESSEEENMALFQRALAELQYLGMIKSTRRRADHVAKVAWRGL